MSTKTGQLLSFWYAEIIDWPETFYGPADVRSGPLCNDDDHEKCNGDLYRFTAPIAEDGS